MGTLTHPRVAKAAAQALTAGAEAGVVRFDDLGWTPTAVKLHVSKPIGGDNLVAAAVADTVASTGFQFTLSGAPPTSGYELHYVCELTGH